MRYMISDFGYEQSGVIMSQKVFGYEICDIDYDKSGVVMSKMMLVMRYVLLDIS